MVSAQSYTLLLLSSISCRRGELLSELAYTVAFAACQHTVRIVLMHACSCVLRTCVYEGNPVFILVILIVVF